MTCKFCFLNAIRKAIESGVNPDDAIPWTAPYDITQEEYIEVLFYASQVLPEGRRKEEIKKTLQEMRNVSG